MEEKTENVADKFIVEMKDGGHYYFPIDKTDWGVNSDGDLYFYARDEDKLVVGRLKGWESVIDSRYLL